uniref:RRM domain-containing protein n=1 Tax=Panagrellus redivivus TaxID=6233 RepID=A0A7E4ZSA9_PANRE
MAQIGYDTNSRDPAKQKSRVFVGGLSTNVTRDMIIELFASYGKITGATLFKGFAFVQYSTSDEAELATFALNGYTWHKNMLEVKVAYESGKSKGGAGDGGVKRVKRDQGAGAPEKRQKFNDPPRESAPIAQNRHTSVEPTPAVSAPSSTPSKDTGTPDTFLCGGCAYVTHVFEAFVDHRSESCTRKPPKHEGEPEVFRCFTCSNAFDTSWELLYHLRVSHEITMYKVAKA